MCEYENWMYLSQDTVQHRSFIVTEIDLQVPHIFTSLMKYDSLSLSNPNQARCGTILFGHVSSKMAPGIANTLLRKTTKKEKKLFGYFRPNCKTSFIIGHTS